MDENRHRTWDVVLKIVGAIAVVVSFFVGLDQYEDTKEKEFRQHLWEQRIDLYLKATRAAATLASFAGDTAAFRDERERALAEFWQLYYGDMNVVEDSAVAVAMVDFARCLRRFELRECDQRRMSAYAQTLAVACRASIANSWDRELRAELSVPNRVDPILQR